MKEIGSRKQAVTESMAKIRSIAKTQGLSRASLHVVTQELISLAAHRAFWVCPEFAEPKAPHLTAFYQIHKDLKSGYTLYLNVMKPGELTPVHNHTTWACIASVEGVETNYLYKRMDDATQAGYAKLEQIGILAVGARTGIGIMPDDIHAVANTGDTVVRHLHLYGDDVRLLTQRLMFDRETNSYKHMPLIDVNEWHEAGGSTF